MKISQRLFFLLAVFLTAGNLFSQNVGINTSGAVADPSSMLDIVSTTSGVLIPRMTDAQRIAIAAPANGLLVYQTNGTQAGYWYFNGTIWVSLCSNGIYNNMYQLVGTAGVSLTVNGTFILLPGCSQVITLTGNAKVFLHLDAGLQTTSVATNGYTAADFVLAVNGAFLGNGGYRRIIALNNTGLVTNIESCAMGAVVTLAPGTYTFEGYAAKAGGANGNASGNNTSVMQAMLSIIVVYQ